MGGSKKTTSTSTPWKPAQPYILGGLQSVQNTYNQNQPQLQALASSLTGSTIPALQAIAGGSYLNGNPYTAGLANQAGQAAGNAVNSAYSGAGRTGGGYSVSDLARGVDQAQNQALFQNYQNERGLQQQAYTQLLGANQLAGQLPYYGAQSLASTLGALTGGYGQQTQKQPSDLLGNLIGAAAAAAPYIFASDRRLKTNIVKVGEAKDGLGIYEWNWKASGGKARGVIADEVERLRPWAYVKNYRDGYDGVNYAALGSME